MHIRKRVSPQTSLTPAVSSANYQNFTPTAVQVAPASPLIVPTETVQLNFVVRDSVGFVLAGETVTWTTTNASIATVSSSGLVTGVAQGVCRVRAHDGSLVSNDCIVRVGEHIDDFVGGNLTFYTGLTPGNATVLPTGTALMSLPILTGDILHYTDENGNDAFAASASLWGIVTAPGTPGYARLENSDASLDADMDLGGPGASVVINPGAWMVGDEVEVASLTLIESPPTGPPPPGVLTGLLNMFVGWWDYLFKP